MAKSKKKTQAPNQSPDGNGSILHWYEQAGRQGMLDQKPKKKEEKDPGNRLDQSELDKLSAFKKNLETSQADEKKAARTLAQQKAKEAEKNTHWFELAEKQGYLDK